MLKQFLSRLLGTDDKADLYQPSSTKPPVPPPIKLAAGGRIRLFENGTDIDIDDVFSQPFLLVFAAGIVNPFGPTLTAVLVREPPGNDGPADIIRLMLNPFSQEIQLRGVVGDKESISLPDVVKHLPTDWLGSCPTLLMPGKALNTDFGALELSGLLRKLHGARETLDSLERFPRNPWDRISDEMNSAVAAAAGKKSQGAQSVLGPSGSKRLMRILLDKEHFDMEVKAFFAAWKGSIEHGPKGMATLELDEMIACFALLLAESSLQHELFAGDPSA